MKEINHVRENKLNETAHKYTTTTKVLKIVNECVTVVTFSVSAVLIVVGLLAAVQVVVQVLRVHWHLLEE